MPTPAPCPPESAAPLSWALPGPRPVTRRRVVRACMLGAVFAAGMGVLAWYDLSITRSIERGREHPNQTPYWSPDTLFRGLRAFGEFVVIGSVIAAVAALDRRRRLVLAHVVFAILLAGAFQVAGKLVVGRARPNVYAREKRAGVWFRIELDLRDADAASFPSGHTTLAFAFAMTMAWFYPSLRWLFLLLATGCAASRVAHGAHWPGDCWAGAWLGYLASWVALRPHFFHSIIQWWRRRIEN